MKDSSDDSVIRNFYLINSHSVYSLNFIVYSSKAGILFLKKDYMDHSELKMFGISKF